MAELRGEIYDMTARTTYSSRSASYILHRTSYIQQFMAETNCKHKIEL